MTTSSPAAEPLSAAELAARYGIGRVGKRPPLGRYVRELWHRRAFTFELARSRFLARTSQDRLGLLWVVLRPLIQAAVYGAIFGLLMPSSTRPDNFIPFLVIGVFLFTFTSGALNSGAKAITGNAALVRALRFPRALLPVSTTLIEFLSTLPVLGVLAIIVLATGEPVSFAWLLVLPAVVLQLLFNLGLAFLVARITAAVRDFAQLLPFIIRIVFYLSGVFFDISRFSETTEHWLSLNPIHVYLALARGALLEGFDVTAGMWLTASAWAVGTLLVGFLFFWRGEESYGRG